MTINNDVPATELSIGSDTAPNSIVADVDKIRSPPYHPAGIRRRGDGPRLRVPRVAEWAGVRRRANLHAETGITLDSLTADIAELAPDSGPANVSA